VRSPARGGRWRSHRSERMGGTAAKAAGYAAASRARTRATAIAATKGLPAPRFSDYAAASLARTRMTVSADHGAPVGVATLRAFSSAAALFADRAVSAANTGRRASARSAAALLLASD
jgi:hypothetical protein